MKAAVIQFKPEKGQPEAAWTALSSLIRQAGEEGAQLIICPEMALSGYLFSNVSAAMQIAEPQHGGNLSKLAALAAAYGAYLVCGYPELGADENGTACLYNAARIIGPRGQLLGNYRKRLLFDSDYTWARPGDTPYPIFDLADGRRMSVGICMDLNDDRFVAFLRQQRPALVAFCTNWLDEGVDVLPYWQYRLHGTSGYFLAANTYGSEEAPGHPRTQFCGGSAILGPKGRLLARGPHTGDAVVLADL